MKNRRGRLKTDGDRLGIHHNSFSCAATIQTRFIPSCAQQAVDMGIRLAVSGLWHQLNTWGLSFKKTLHASEQEREDVRQAREAWIHRKTNLFIRKICKHTERDSYGMFPCFRQ
ncbi:MAG: hypothetical protein LBQ62_04050 [Candidatus Accumulibacter sp.]|jgi:hypothetical protein|nr:hypothetical protein [Accumulibacter sp.]